MAQEMTSDALSYDGALHTQGGPMSFMLRFHAASSVETTVPDDTWLSHKANRDQEWNN